MYVHTNMHTGREARKNKDQNIPQDDQEVTKIVRAATNVLFSSRTSLLRSERRGPHAQAAGRQRKCQTRLYAFRTFK